MQKITEIDGLKSNQNLSYEEKQALIRKEIEVYASSERFLAYRRGIAAAERAVGQLLNNAHGHKTNRL